jgi:hypothetical protein
MFNNNKRMEEFEMLSMESSPMDILKSLMRVDDAKK